MEGIQNKLSNLNITTKNLTKTILITSAMLLSSCKDEQITHNNQTSLENIQHHITSYEPNTQELGIHGKYIMTLAQNSDGTSSISKSDLYPTNVDIITLQKYCDTNHIDIIIDENNKIEVVEAIIAMLFKDELLSQGKEELGLYVFNTINNSNSKNILSAGPFDDGDQTEIITDNTQDQYIKSADILSLEDQYLLAEEKQNDTTLTIEERKKRTEKYNRMSTEIFKPSQEEITSILDQ